MNELFRSLDAGPFGRRLRNARGARIPVAVVTGFLGAGKTTLVKRFLDSEQGSGTALIVNEYGEVGIDDALLRRSADETRLLGNGCLCCNVRSDLQETLRRLLFDRERGLVPHFRQIVIETSGLADPGPILTSFATDRALGGECHLDAVVTLVDAVNGESALDRYPEARRQALLADRLVLTKTDLVSPQSRDFLVGRLRGLNPRAEIVTADSSETATALFDPGNGSMRFHSDEALAEARHSDDIASFTLVWDRPLAWSVFAQTMDALLSLRGADVLRAKGFLNVEGCSGPVVVQFVQHLAHSPAELQQWPDGDRTSRVVFIVRDIAERQVRALFDAVQALATPRI